MDLQGYERTRKKILRNDYFLSLGEENEEENKTILHRHVSRIFKLALTSHCLSWNQAKIRCLQNIVVPYYKAVQRTTAPMLRSSSVTSRA
jgi:hypothetical protein